MCWQVLANLAKVGEFGVTNLVNVGGFGKDEKKSHSGRGRVFENYNTQPSEMFKLPPDHMVM